MRLALFALSALAAFAALSLGPTGCSSAGCEPRAVVPVPAPPPAPLPEMRQTPPTPGMLWMGGYWHWDGTIYVWIPGHYIPSPGGRRWVPPEVRYDGETGGYLYREEGFGCEAADEP